MSSHSMTAASPMAPPTTTPTASILPAPLLPVVAEGATLGLVVGVLVEEAAAEELLVATAWTREGARVPQVLQASEPGLAIRQSANVC